MSLVYLLPIAVFCRCRLARCRLARSRNQMPPIELAPNYRISARKDGSTGKVSVSRQMYALRMSIVLSHISALSMRGHLPKRNEDLRIQELIAQTPHLTPENTKTLESIDRPLHVLIADKKFRRRAKEVQCHVWKKSLPQGAILDIGGDVYVSSPEFCFVQMAQSLSLLQTIELGYDLCGRYHISKNEITLVEPLTTVAKLESFVSQMHNVHGIRKTSRALPYVVDNSASPMETRLVMLLCLPYKLGGYGLSRPLLNYRVDLTAAKYYVCDLMWPEECLALEYDSDQFHTNERNIGHDSIKRTHLARAGVTVYSVTRSQIQSRYEVDVLARLLAQHMGKRIRVSEPQFSRARYELRNSLRLAP